MKESLCLPHFFGLALLAGCFLAKSASAQTIALWPFDEPKGLYPSCVLDDISDNNCPLVIGPGGQIVEGKFGNALDPIAQPAVRYPSLGSILFGLAPAPKPPGRTIDPMTWKNALFAALMTMGEKHLRKEVGFVNPTLCKLNLGDFDWTVEFWYRPMRKPEESGVVFEIGRGPRGENDDATQLATAPDGKGFVLFNQPGGVRLPIPTDPAALDPASPQWHHLAFVYSVKESRLRHYVDGKEQPAAAKTVIKPLPPGDEAYFSVGRDGLWQKPLPGRIDELRFSAGRIYTANFAPPASLSPLTTSGTISLSLQKGPPLLFGGQANPPAPIPLMGRKYLFIDDAIASKTENIVFTANPARLAERVIGNIQGAFRKHLNVLEDENGLLRMYFGVKDDYLAVMTSRDGVHWEKPAINAGATPEMQNIVIPESTGMGMVFIDPNGPSEQRWKFISGYEGRGVYLYTSPDGWRFKRSRTAVLPFRSGSQSNIFYDDQRQLYVGYHRSDYGTTLGGKTQREFIRTETGDIARPWPFKPLTQAEVESASRVKRLHNLNPWYLDNGPLTPGGFGIEYPTAFAPDDAIDPEGADIYVPKAMKYPWAPDTYVAFPLLYLHYEEEGPAVRRILGEKQRERGSGPIETQLAVSRDGIRWKRYPRPAYVGIGTHAGDPIHQVYLAQGMIRRGDEVWQYYFGEEAYHSSWKQNLKRAVYRVVQRLDGFVSADSPYGLDGLIVTKPLIFEGNRLMLNIDTDAAGYAQAGLLDENGRPITGFGMDDCIYINGDYTQAEVEWLGKGKDVSPLQEKPVRLVLRMRGSKLYAMQFLRR